MKRPRATSRPTAAWAGGGTNEIRFEDLKDSEQLLINAQKDLHIRVGDSEGEERHNVKDNQFLVVGGEQRKKVEGNRSAEVGGKDALHVTDTRSVTVDGDVMQDYKANHGHKVASQYLLKANQAVIESDAGISLKCGGNFIVISSAGIFIKGSLVAINSGGAALPGTASTSAASPAEPEEADEVKPGEDKSYERDLQAVAAVKQDPYKGQWISIDLKDGEGDPRAGEAFVITTPSGKELVGALDVNGFARKWVDEEGSCQISYPNLSPEEWQQG